jgi:hypothetical protein
MTDTDAKLRALAFLERVVATPRAAIIAPSGELCTVSLGRHECYVGRTVAEALLLAADAYEPGSKAERARIEADVRRIIQEEP